MALESVQPVPWVWRVWIRLADMTCGVSPGSASTSSTRSPAVSPPLAK